MIIIEDNDLPITVVQKIISGTRRSNASDFEKRLAKAFTHDPEAGETIDMFSLDEILEISTYLKVYYDSHKDGD